MFVSMGIIGGIVSTAQDDTVTIKKKTVLTIDLSKGVVDRASSNPFEEMNFQTFKPENKVGLNAILKNLKKAKDDENIKGIYINSPGVNAGTGTLEEIRNAILDFKTSGKFVISYADAYSQSSYYLATASDKIYLNPEGLVDFKGLSSQLMFFRDALDKLGVEPIIIRGKNNKFKSAVEPFMYNHISEANRLQTLTYMGSIWNHILEGISKTRGISVEELNMLADSMLVSNAKATVEYKLVDELKYYDEVLAELKEKSETEEDDDINFMSISKYSKTPNKPTGKGLIKEKIAVVYASGEINMGAGSNSEIGSEGTSKAIREARLDTSVKALVLRVNSPGGSALASEVIWREVILTKAVKPVVVSMGDVAASGGYYISAPADKIFANPTTITGSIGVFGILWNGQNLMNKIGINSDAVNTNAHSDIGSTARPMSDVEYAVIQKSVEEVYDVFLGHVAEGRNKTKEQVDEIGQGRVWSGENAKEIGLIDEFGGLNEAIEAAKELAKLEDYRLLELPKQKDPMEELLSNFGANVKANIIKEELGTSYQYYNRLNKLTKLNGVQARMPFVVDIK
jgi:protease-4